VEVGDDVEVGAGTTIDRGTFGPTRVGAGTTVGSLVMVGHNCRIGRDNVLASQVGIAGSSSTGDGVAVGAQAGVVDHVHLGTGAAVGPRSAVTRSVPVGEKVLGYPARPAGHAKRCYAILRRLPQLWADVRRLKAFLGLDAGPRDERA
jgi:UDP-3-O-[3-hydroxymyristoyl] glucosamine N-acyltransferase